MKFLRPILVCLIVLIAAVSAARVGRHKTSMPAAYLEARVHASAPGWFEVFFDEGDGIRPGLSAVTADALPLRETTVRLAIPHGRLKALRIDPLERPGEITISDLRIVDPYGNVVRSIDPAAIQARSQIRTISTTANSLRVTTDPDAVDPQLHVALTPTLDFEPLRRTPWSEYAIAFLLLVSGLALAAGAGLAVLRCIRRASAELSSEPVPPAPTRRMHFGWRWWALTTGSATSLVVVVALLVLDLNPNPESARAFAFQIDIATSASGYAQFFYDSGRDFTEEQSSRQGVRSDQPLHTLSFPMPAGIFRAMRFDPMNGSGTAILAHPRIVRLTDGAVVREFSLADFKPNGHIAAFEASDGRARLDTGPDGFDPALVLEPDGGLVLTLVRWAAIRPALVPAALAIVGLVALCALADLALRTRPVMILRRAAGNAARTRPRLCLLALAVASTVVCCHPVVFLGRSLFTPNYITNLLYAGIPSLPDQQDSEIEDVFSADTGAMLWQHLPYSVIQHRALFEDGELPLWNRNNSCGTVLLGQGQSMFGDPFHLVVIAADGATWAWDFKFVLARFLFAAGCAWLVFAATRHFPAAALIAITAAFVGFFTFRINHPAYVSFCYAPWIAVAWIELSTVAALERARGWSLLLLLANWCELTSGTVKEAAMLALVLNAAGVAVFVLGPAPRAVRARLALVLGIIAASGVLVAAPWWTTFAHTLTDAWTSYDKPTAIRLPPQLFISLFDGIFASEAQPARNVVAPSSNFLVLFGLLACLAHPRALLRDRASLVFLATTGVAASLAFGVSWLPTEWILRLPLLRSVGHIHNTFSCVAVVASMVPAGRGWAETIGDARRGVWARTVTVAALVAAGLLAYYASYAMPLWSARAQLSWIPFVAEKHAFFTTSVVLLVAGWAGVVASLLLARRPMLRSAVAPLAAASLIAILARHGEQVRFGNDDYFFNPVSRVAIHAPSVAVMGIQHMLTEPARVFGIDGNLYPGFHGVYGLENINGADGIENRYYRELTQAAGLSTGISWCFPYDVASVADKQRILDMLGTRFYVASSATHVLWPWVRPVIQSDLAVFESPTHWPRAFFVDGVIPYSTAGEFVQRLKDGDGRPFAAVLREDLPSLANVPGSGNSHPARPARSYRTTSNSTSFVVEASGPGLAVLTEAWLPRHFQATLDGVRVPYVRVNHAFKAVVIPDAGTHVIRFTYWPEWMTGALALSAVGIAVLVVVFAWKSRKKADSPDGSASRP